MKNKKYLNKNLYNFNFNPTSKLNQHKKINPKLKQKKKHKLMI